MSCRTTNVIPCTTVFLLAADTVAFLLVTLPPGQIEMVPGEHMKLRISLWLAVAVLINSQLLLARAKGVTTPEQVKAEVFKRGTGEKAKVKVKLRDGSEVRGYINKANEDSFEVHEKAGKSVTLAYSDVISVRKPGLSRGAKIGISVGVGAAAFFAVVYAATVSALGQ